MFEEITMDQRLAQSVTDKIPAIFGSRLVLFE